MVVLTGNDVLDQEQEACPPPPKKSKGGRPRKVTNLMVFSTLIQLLLVAIARRVGLARSTLFAMVDECEAKHLITSFFRPTKKDPKLLRQALLDWRTQFTEYKTLDDLCFPLSDNFWRKLKEVECSGALSDRDGAQQWERAQLEMRARWNEVAQMFKTVLETEILDDSSHVMDPEEAADALAADRLNQTVARSKAKEKVGELAQTRESIEKTRLVLLEELLGASKVKRQLFAAMLEAVERHRRSGPSDDHGNGEDVTEEDTNGSNGPSGEEEEE